MKLDMSNDDASSGNIFGKPRKVKKFNIFKLISSRNNEKKSSVSERIVKAVSENNHSKRKIREKEQEILMNAVNFTDSIVEDIMIPRGDIIAIDINADFAALKKILLDTGHTRVPVYAENLDNVKGYVHIKDLLSYFDSDRKFNISDIMRNTLFIPPAMRVVDVMHKMRMSGIRIAIVIDEYGGTDGMITIENLIEEIVGDIDNNEIVSIEKDSYEANARVKIEDLEEKLHLKLVDKNKFQDDFDTLGGLIVSLCKKIPETGDVIEHPSGIKFHIKEAEARYIKKVVIQL